MPILDASRLHKRFAAFTALEDVSFALEPGEVVGFLGPNGAGKSTTMKILTGFLAPTAGTATIAGHDLQADPLACRRAVGYLPEEAPLYLDMTVEDYLDHVARLKGIAPAERRRAVVEAMESAWCAENAKRRIRKLSKGNRQRAGLAQALIGRPPILILDEPTSGLDPTQVAHFRDLVRSIARRHTVLLSTHILAEVEAVADRVIVVHRGRTIADQPIAELTARTRGRAAVRVRLLGGDPSAFLAAAAAAGFATGPVEDAGILVESAPARRGELAALAEAHGGLRELAEERRPLEAVFADLVAAGVPPAPSPDPGIVTRSNA